MADLVCVWFGLNLFQFGLDLLPVINEYLGARVRPWLRNLMGILKTRYWLRLPAFKYVGNKCFSARDFYPNGQ